MTRIKTKRLLLRRYSMADLAFFASLWADPEVVRYIGDGVTRSQIEAEERLVRIVNGYESGYGLLAIYHQESEQLIGHAGLVQQTVDGSSEIELGYWLAREFWGHGFATEAALAVRDYSFQDLGRGRIISLIQPSNRASIGVAERIGMNLEKNTQFKGQVVCVYSMNR